MAAAKGLVWRFETSNIHAIFQQSATPMVKDILHTIQISGDFPSIATKLRRFAICAFILSP